METKEWRAMGIAMALGSSLATMGCDADQGGDGVADPAIAQTEHGAVEGLVQDDHRRFLGIPYAAPPVGELRWQAPRPPQAWSGVRDATKPGAHCPQLAQTFADVESLDEDCLFLDVTTPLDASPGTAKPVMVWLHGGGGTNGAGSLFDPRRLVVEGDVVVVTPSYRLGIFGAFGLPGLEGSGTFGLQDQRAALEWVQRNIAAFGGDPDNVTLFGHSYGAYSTAAHLISPGSSGLFHRAAMQSSPAMLDYPEGTLMPGVPVVASTWRSAAELEGIGTYVAEQLGCADPKTALECLRALPVETLLTQGSLFSSYAFGNDVLPEEPGPALRAGRFHRVPVLSGSTRDEARLFVGLFYDLAGAEITAEQYPELIATAFGEDAEAVLERYPLEGFESPSLAWAAVITDRVWALRTMEQHRALAEHVPTFAYEFADRQAPITVPFPPGFPPGAHHNAEVAYQFTVAGREEELTAEQWELARRMNRYWSNFARTGDPSGGELPAWPAFDPEADVPAVLSLAPGDGGIEPVDYAAGHQLDFWMSLIGK